MSDPSSQSEEIKNILTQPDIWDTELSYLEIDQSYSARRLQYTVGRLCERDKKDVIAGVAIPIGAAILSLVGLESVIKGLVVGVLTLIATLGVIFFLHWLSAPRELDDALKGDLRATKNQLAEERRKLVRVATIAAENGEKYLKLASTALLPPPAPDAWLEELKRTHDLIPLQPNLKHPLEGTLVDVREENHGVIVRGHIENGKNYRAIIATYKNSPDTKTKRRIIGVNGIVAEVSYFFFDATPSLVMYHGAWLSEKDHKVSFDVPGKHDLIAATVESDDRLFAVEREFTSAYPQGNTNRVELIGDLFRLGIQLIDSAGEVLDDYEMMLTVNREPELKTELLSAKFWLFSRYRDFANEGHDLLFKAYEITKKFMDESIETIKTGNMDLTTIHAKEREEEVPLAAEAKEWQRRVGEFIGVHRGEEQKKSFLSTKPSIEDGLDRVRKHAFDLLPKPDEKPETVREYNWTLIDSLKAGTEKLSKIFDRY